MTMNVHVQVLKSIKTIQVVRMSFHLHFIVSVVSGRNKPFNMSLIITLKVRPV